MNLHTKRNRLTDIENKLTVTKGERGNFQRTSVNSQNIKNVNIKINKRDGDNVDEILKRIKQNLTIKGMEEEGEDKKIREMVQLI